MRLFDRFDNYINENKYVINIVEDVVSISNYSEIKEFSSTKIIITHKGGRSVIIGSNLVIKMMFNDEIKITGSIDNIILR